MSVSFEDITTDYKVDTIIESHIEDPSDGHGWDYISQANTEFLIKFKLKYEGELLEFNFCVDTSAEFNAYKQIIDTNNRISEIFQLKLDNLKAPVYVVDYIKEQLKEFLSECTHDRFINIFDNLD